MPGRSVKVTRTTSDAQAIAEAQRPLPKQRADDQRRHCAGHSRSAAQLSIVPFEANGVEFCADAEERRSSRRIPMVLRELKEGNAKPFAFMQHIVQRMRKATSKVYHVEALAH